MFTAIGIGVRKNPDTSVTVKARITDDRDQSVKATREYTANTVLAIRALIQIDLDALKAAETDGALTLAVVGQVLGAV